LTPSNFTFAHHQHKVGYSVPHVSCK